MYRYIKFVLALFTVTLVTLFIQHHVELSDSKPTNHDVYIYYPPGSGKIRVKTSKKEYKRYLINVRLSDSIPINRKIPDSRPESCPQPRSSHLSVSIVITFYREWPSILLRTIYSVINRTTNLKQLILVDDGGESDVAELLQYAKSSFGSVIKVITLRQRRGLIGARLEGVKHVTGDVLCFLDSHMEVNMHWIEPLLNVLRTNPKAVAMSQLDTINAQTFEYEYSRNYRARYGFDWRLQFFETEYRPSQIEDGDLVLPGVIAVGSAFAIRLKFFKQIGMYDPSLKVWGGENLELSFKVWLCGGELVHVACSRVGHITRSQPYLQKDRRTIEMFNYRRVADVWMNKYVSYVNDQYSNMKNIDVGSLLQQKRQRIRCKPFSWFLENVWPELYPYTNKTMIENSASGFCLDNEGYLFSGAKRLVSRSCSNDLNTQLFSFTDDGRLRTLLQCVFVKRDGLDFVPYIQNCLQEPLDYFMHKKNGEIVHKKSGFCLTQTEFNIQFKECFASKSQQWTIQMMP